MPILFPLAFLFSSGERTYDNRAWSDVASFDDAFITTPPPPPRPNPSPATNPVFSRWQLTLFLSKTPTARRTRSTSKTPSPSRSRARATGSPSSPPTAKRPSRRIATSISTPRSCRSRRLARDHERCLSPLCRRTSPRFPPQRGV